MLSCTAADTWDPVPGNLARPLPTVYLQSMAPSGESECATSGRRDWPDAGWQWV